METGFPRCFMDRGGLHHCSMSVTLNWRGSLKNKPRDPSVLGNSGQASAHTCPRRGGRVLCQPAPRRFACLLMPEQTLAHGCRDPRAATFSLPCPAAPLGCLLLAPRWEPWRDGAESGRVGVRPCGTAQEPGRPSVDLTQGRRRAALTTCPGEGHR